MKTVLLTAQPARGHWNPLLQIGLSLKSHGHNVVLSGPKAQGIDKYIAGQGLEFRGLHPALSALGLILVPFFSGFAETYYAARFFYAGIKNYTRQLRRIIKEVKPDVIISEFSFLAGIFAGELENIPSVNIYHAGLSFPGPGIPPFASGLPINEDWKGQDVHYRQLVGKMVTMVDNLIGKARNGLHLDPVPANYLIQPVSKWLTLVLTAQVCEAPREPLAPNMYYIGPCFPEKTDSTETDFPFDRFSTDKPKVYVSLGTVFNKKPDVYRSIINGFHDGKYQLIVSAGGAFENLQKQNLPGDVLLFKQVPQIEVLPRVEAVITHGGNNTVNETLAAGKPLLVLPVGGEQGDNASKIVFLEAGLRASIKNFTSEEIREKVDRLFNEPDFNQRCHDIAAGLAQTNGIKTACRFVEHLIEHPGPIERPRDYPETVTQNVPLPWEKTK